MKRILFLLSFIANSFVTNAQVITANSSAEDCVNFINKVAQTNNGKDRQYDWVNSYVFKGGVFIALSEAAYSKFKDSYTNIDWGKYKKTDVQDDKYGGVVVSFGFESNDIIATHISIDKTTGFISDRDSDNYSSLSITIPLAEKSKVPELEAAARRLQQIAKEKGNIFSSQSGIPPLRVKNIEGKPTFKETVDYINKFLKDNENVSMFCNSADFKNREAIVGEKENGKVYLQSKYLFQGRYTAGSPVRNESFLIDLSEIEKIDIVFQEGFQGGCLQVGLWFIAKGKSASPIMHLPLSNTSFNGFQKDTFKQEKIFKAFEHLRKLCGAPEPISFD